MVATEALSVPSTRPARCGIYVAVAARGQPPGVVGCDTAKYIHTTIAGLDPMMDNVC